MKVHFLPVFGKDIPQDSFQKAKWLIGARRARSEIKKVKCRLRKWEVGH